MRLRLLATAAASLAAVVISTLPASAQDDTLDYVALGDSLLRRLRRPPPRPVVAAVRTLAGQLRPPDRRRDRRGVHRRDLRGGPDVAPDERAVPRRRPTNSTRSPPTPTWSR
ncbi:hypothetical protein [Nocardioides convexus]|uniref:hypothetical protein n=1 Tax=Nocardioides convexus TaxID=2712224 RepID=UPI0024187FB2|nr:hypothetical protein [Nocardioides convexus]